MRDKEGRDREREREIEIDREEKFIFWLFKGNMETKWGVPSLVQLEI
mgnify:CR=1 FL=1